MNPYTEDHYAIYNFSGCPGMRYSKIIKNIIGELHKKQWWDNKFTKCLWFILSCFLGLLAFILVIFFYLFFGCAYEFIKCYLTKSEDSDEASEASVDYERGNNNQNNSPEDEDLPLTRKQKWIVALLGTLGFLMQPLYLMFYLLFAIMECYRRLPCWAIYAL